MAAAFERHRGMGRGGRFVFLFLALAAGAQAPPAPQPGLHHTYPVTRNQHILLRNFFGNVRVTAWDRPEVRVDAVASFGSGKTLSSNDIVVTSRPDSFCIATRYGAPRGSLRQFIGLEPDPCRDQQGIPAGRNTVANVDYTYFIPRESRVTIFVNEGNVDIEGLAGGFFVDIDQGHLRARDVGGDCKLFGPYSGVNVTLTRLARDTHLTTAVGPLIVYLAPDISARVRARSHSRGVFNDFGWQQKPHEDLQGELGKSGPLLDVTDFNGRVEIRRLQAQEPEPTAKKTTRPAARKKSP